MCRVDFIFLLSFLFSSRHLSLEGPYRYVASHIAFALAFLLVHPSNLELPVIEKNNIDLVITQLK
jgi:hypothetical protein